MPRMVLADDLHTLESYNAIPRRDPDASAIESAWYFFETLLYVILRSFGAPKDLYETIAIRVTEGRPLAILLRGLEAMARRILLMMAGADDSPVKPFKERARRILKNPVPIGAARKKWRPHHPDSLPAFVPLIPPLPSFAPRRRTKAPLRRRVEILYGNGHPLASRLEALIRIYENPEPYVLRLRRTLAMADGKLAPALCTRIMVEPPGLQADHPHIQSALRDLEPEASAAIDCITRRSG